LLLRIDTVSYLQYLATVSTHGRRAFSHRRPHSLELSPGFHPGPDYQYRVFQTFA